MEFIKTDKRGGVLVIILSRGKANSMNWQMVEDLRNALSQARSDTGTIGVVIESDSPKFFSGGFDISEVFAYDRAKMTEFFGNFMDFYQSVFHFPKPVVAAIGGHAYAGGAVLSLACDFRIFAQGDYGFALNEIKLGVVLPPSIVNMAIDAVGYQSAYHLGLTGASLTPARALQIGLASELVEPPNLLERSVSMTSSLAEKTPSAFAGLKADLRKAAGRSNAGVDRNELETFIESWFSPEAERCKHELVKSMSK
ncbi:MAG TPA: enoyl-CoA hydratase/isomerase family protein [Blastocatellia bacterium]|nr:enoyl-CoA hydratase/isomerase family protein [Blastocatellia bacterium]